MMTDIAVTPYLSLDSLLQMVAEPNRMRLTRLFDDHRVAFAHARGSSANHQPWSGGFWDHTQEVLNIACILYESLSARRPLPFEISDALLVLAVHDLEKMVRYDRDGNPDPALDSKQNKAAFRLALIARYEIQITPEQANALRYAEGVRDSEYSNTERTMGPLAAFVHTCDLLSARLWFDYPLADSDPWPRATRHIIETGTT